MQVERKKMWVAQSVEVMRELSLVEWSVFTGVVSAFVVMTIHMVRHF